MKSVCVCARFCVADVDDFVCRMPGFAVAIGILVFAGVLSSVIQLLAVISVADLLQQFSDDLLQLQPLLTCHKHVLCGVGD